MVQQLKKKLATLALAAVMTVGAAFQSIAWAADSGKAADGSGPANQRPFPQHTAYRPGIIKPNHVSQAQLDNDVRRIYDEWKARYVKQVPGHEDQYYVFYNLEGYAYPENAVTVSEANGYGMLATVLMAGHDKEAKTLFDGMYRFYKAHPSSINPALMAWQQVNIDGQIVDNPEGGSDSATDGDMDIVYSLLLADKQWGSQGEIDYYGQAREMMRAMMKQLVNQSEWTLKLGDWAQDTDAKFGKATRPSDFMLSHLRTFRQASGDERWGKTASKTYDIIHALFAGSSPKTGLLPDFVVKKGKTYIPAPTGFLEADTDGKYSWNSSRTPWRIPIDYMLTGDKRALKQLTTLNKWIQKATGSEPNKVAPGYNLDGKAIPGNDYTSMAFTAPFAVSATIDKSNQKWLNSLWKAMAESPTKDGAYFDNSIRLLVMITVSGNWWSP